MLGRSFTVVERDESEHFPSPGPSSSRPADCFMCRIHDCSFQCSLKRGMNPKSPFVFSPSLSQISPSRQSHGVIFLRCHLISPVVPRLGADGCLHFVLIVSGTTRALCIGRPFRQIKGGHRFWTEHFRPFRSGVSPRSLFFSVIPSTIVSGHKSCGT